MQPLQSIIEAGFEDRAKISPQNAPAEIKNAVSEIIESLDTGKLRVAEKINNQWQVNEWVKKAVLLYYRLYDNEIMHGNITQYFDKVPLKLFVNYSKRRKNF